VALIKKKVILTNKKNLDSLFKVPWGSSRERKSVFGSVVAGAFQTTFRTKMHVNDVFLFFKTHF
jgi:hypothetical protein